MNLLCLTESILSEIHMIVVAGINDDIQEHKSTRYRFTHILSELKDGKSLAVRKKEHGKTHTD